MIHPGTESQLEKIAGPNVDLVVMRFSLLLSNASISVMIKALDGSGFTIAT